ncbi:aromatic prenyltransferase (DMATS family) [Aspergillus brasiliensis]|uniref:Aromatic prenyltransferase (DMATS family) n=1 Tax=Aspergillus brasiliensis TaxID=319629 RepID=A0A9W5Z0I7_9EURO|nr:aromatic prenyltransferase (DMATS family) [Aspergillus brasiliensis]GKZ51321.1 aromatic prenyltransferase (DMATS family) [Aspergillus brasiliensis]
MSASNNEVYQTLSKAFDFPNESQRLWWHSTAPMFAEMLQTANYNVHDQYLHLGVYKKHVVPFLGVYPSNGQERWLSILTRYGTPFELSLNLSNSLVRYTFEPINDITGTDIDPFNSHAIWEPLYQLMNVGKGIDIQYFSHFKRDLTLDPDEASMLQRNGEVRGEIRTQNKLALDLDKGNFIVKAYIYPALKTLATQKPIQELIFKSVHRLAKEYPQIIPSLQMLEDYITSRGSDSTASPRLLSCDLVDPSYSRIKIYMLERMVSLSALKDLWTLGGRRNDISTQAGWEMVRELWDLLQIPSGLRSYPEGYLPLGTRPNELLPTMANYTLLPDHPIPQPQVYFTPFGMSDLAIANALTAFFERRGWVDMAAKYKNSLRAYYPTQELENLNYLHAYISFSYRKNKPYLAVYLQSFETGSWHKENKTPTVNVLLTT